MTRISRRTFFEMAAAGAALTASAKVCATESQAQSLSSLTTRAQPITARSTPRESRRCNR